MMIKRVMFAALFSLMLAIGMAGRAVVEARRVSPAQTRRAPRRTGVRKPVVAPKTPQTIVPSKDEFTRRQTLRGEIISVEASRFTLRDERGLDTVIILFPDTFFKIETTSGALKMAARR
jgi:hypothetical protein